MYIYKIIILCGLLLGSVGLKAQEAQCSIDRKLRADPTNRNRIITRATMYGVGFTNVFDTYLSPQEYKGIDFGSGFKDVFGRQPYSTVSLPDLNDDGWSIDELTNQDEDIVENECKARLNFELPLLKVFMETNSSSVRNIQVRIRSVI